MGVLLQTIPLESTILFVALFRDESHSLIFGKFYEKIKENVK